MRIVRFAVPAKYNKGKYNNCSIDSREESLFIGVGDRGQEINLTLNPHGGDGTSVEFLLDNGQAVQMNHDGIVDLPGRGGEYSVCHFRNIPGIGREQIRVNRNSTACSADFAARVLVKLGSRPLESLHPTLREAYSLEEAAA